MLKCNATVSCNTKQYHTTNKCNNFICHMSERPQTSSFSEADFWKSLMTIRPLWSPNLLHCTIFIKDLLIPSKNTLFFEAAFWRRSTIWSLLQSSLYYLLAQSHHSHWCWASQFSSFTTFVKNDPRTFNRRQQTLVGFLLKIWRRSVIFDVFIVFLLNCGTAQFQSKICSEKGKMRKYRLLIHSLWSPESGATSLTAVKDELNDSMEKCAILLFLQLWSLFSPPPPNLAHRRPALQHPP